MWCELVAPDRRCPGCGAAGRVRDHVQRELTDLPVVGHPTRLHLRIPRLVCESVDCPTSIFRASIDTLAAVTRRATKWILQCRVLDRMSVAVVARSLGLSRNTVSALALNGIREIVYMPGHLDGVRVLGVDEHKWKHVRGVGDPSFVTVIVDLTPVLDGTGPARLLDMVPGRSAAALRSWLDKREQSF